MSDSNNSDQDVSASEASFIPSEEDDNDDDDYSDAAVAVAAAKKTKNAKMKSPIPPKASKASPKKSPMNSKRKLSSNVTSVQDDDSSNVAAATSRKARKKTVAEKSMVRNDENDVKVGSSSSRSLSTPSKDTSISTPKKSSTKSRPRKGPGSIYQSDGYDIVLPSTALLEHVPNPNEFSLLIQIDTSTVINSGTNSNLGTAPSTLRMTSGSVIGRLELLSPPTTTPGHHNNDNNNHRIKFDYHGTEYIGQIYPGPTAMILSLAQQQPPPQPEKRDHSGIDDTAIATSAVKMEIDGDNSNGNDKTHATAASPTTTAPTASSCVLVVDHIVNEFCNMIPAAAVTVSNDATKMDDHGMRLSNTFVTGTTGSGNVDYFQYNDDIYDVNKTTTIAADNDNDDDVERRPTKKPKKNYSGSTTVTSSIGTTSRKVSSIVKNKRMKRK